MGFLAVLFVALLVLALVMYWIFSATARHVALRERVLAQPAVRARRQPRADPDI